MSTWCREDSTISVEQICSFFFSLKSSFLLLVSCLFSFSLDNIYISYVLFLWKGLDLINVNIALPPHCLNLLISLSTMMHCQHGDERKHVLTTSDHVSHTQENEAFIKHSCHFYQTHNTCRCHDSFACSFPTGKALQVHLDWQESRLANPMNLPQTKSNPGSDMYGQQRMACREKRLLSWFWYMRIKLLNNLTIVLRLFIHRETDHWSERKNKRWKEDKGALSDYLCQVHSTPSHSNTIASDR